LMGGESFNKGVYGNLILYIPIQSNQITTLGVCARSDGRWYVNVNDNRQIFFQLLDILISKSIQYIQQVRAAEPVLNDKKHPNPTYALPHAGKPVVWNPFSLS
jgi:hypothetical protein